MACIVVHCWFANLCVDIGGGSSGETTLWDRAMNETMANTREIVMRASKRVHAQQVYCTACVNAVTIFTFGDRLISGHLYLLYCCICVSR